MCVDSKYLEKRAPRNNENNDGPYARDEHSAVHLRPRVSYPRTATRGTIPSCIPTLIQLSVHRTECELTHRGRFMHFRARAD